MKYFLKKTNIKKGEYLQIYKSEYIRGKGSRNTSYKAIGYTEELKSQGIKDPVKEAQKEVDKLNAALREKEEALKVKKIGKTSPEKNLGYFALKGVASSLGEFNKSINTLTSSRQFQYDVYNTMMALVYSRIILPSSKKKTLEQVFPQLFEKIDSSYDQVLSCCEYMGSEYKKIINVLTHAIKNVYGLDFNTAYFDCTNYYFEIDKEDEFRKKGPSKENRMSPIVGMGLLLDGKQIPIGMTMYPGNESEKPQLREVIKGLRKENEIKGKIIQVADKGLNCAQNIYEALKNGDGYIFSRSIKTQKKEEIEWFKRVKKEEDGWEIVSELNDRGEKEEKYRYLEYDDEFTYTFRDENEDTKSFKVRERRVLTLSPILRRKKLLEINKQIEKAKKLCLYKAKRDEFGECGRYVTFETENGDKAIAKLNEDLIEREREWAGYNLLVTSEVNLRAQSIYKIYHNLWRIEQSFRIMKSYLDARPVNLSTPNKIKGHFLICYIGIVLERILELKVLNGRFSHEKIIQFIRNFRVVRMDSKDYINTLTDSDEVGQFFGDYVIPQVTNLTIKPSDVTALLKLKLNKMILV